MFIRRLKDCDEFIAGDNSILRELLHPDKADLRIRYSLAHATVKSGERTTPHRLRTAEVYYILQGQGRMHIDEEAAQVDIQSAIYIPPGSVQFIENTGAEDLVFLCLVDPAWRREDEVIDQEGGNRLAVDIVLLPDEAMTNRVLEINRRLVADGHAEIVLSQESCLPHISLAMGGIEETDIATVRKRLEDLARKTSVRQLRIAGGVSSLNIRGETTSILEVERTEGLQTLHEQVMKEMTPFFRYDVTAAMLHDGVAAPSTLDWVRTYRQKASYEHFDPHITIGYGRVPPGLSFPIPFTAAKLALCHLGNHGTCRKVLTAVTL